MVKGMQLMDKIGIWAGGKNIRSSLITLSFAGCVALIGVAAGATNMDVGCPDPNVSNCTIPKVKLPINEDVVNVYGSCDNYSYKATSIKCDANSSANSGNDYPGLCIPGGEPNYCNCPTSPYTNQIYAEVTITCDESKAGKKKK